MNTIKGPCFHINTVRCPNCMTPAELADYNANTYVKYSNGTSSAPLNPTIEDTELEAVFEKINTLINDNFGHFVNTKKIDIIEILIDFAEAREHKLVLQGKIEEIESIYVASDGSLWHMDGYKGGDSSKKQYNTIRIDERIEALQRELKIWNI